MDEYIEREALLAEMRKRFEFLADNYYARYGSSGLAHTSGFAEAMDFVYLADVADVAPVAHGRWIEADEHPDDVYYHHKCSNCDAFALFDYKYREDWDEGMDGEWYSMGIIDDGINEHLTNYCPHCGAKMDGERYVEET